MLAGFLSALLIIAKSSPVNAHCPLCTGATVAGLAVAEKYGVDSAISGIWVGAFVISTALWFARVLKKKYDFPGQGIIVSLAAMVLTIVPFYFAGMFGHPVKILGVDRLLFGMIAGSMLTFFGTEFSIWIKSRRGHVLFSFQTIIIVMALLSATSAVFWYLVRNTGVLG